MAWPALGIGPGAERRQEPAGTATQGRPRGCTSQWQGHEPGTLAEPSDRGRAPSGVGRSRAAGWKERRKPRLVAGSRHGQCRR